MFFEISQNKTRRIVKKAITEIDNYFRVPLLCTNAYKALIDEGNSKKHDLLLYKAIEEIIEDVDAIVLAQASMARLLPKLIKLTNKPILTSPESAVEKVMSLLNLGVE